MKKIFLSNGQVCLVNDEDFSYLAGYNWCTNNWGYVHARVDGKDQFIHRMIAIRMSLDLLKGEVDHIDGDQLNNQRDNLRLATTSQNRANSDRNKNNTSGYKGVTWNKAARKWQAQITVNGKTIYLGLFDIPEEAYQAYCEAAEQYFGEFARAVQ